MLNQSKQNTDIYIACFNAHTLKDILQGRYNMKNGTLKLPAAIILSISLISCIFSADAAASPAVGVKPIEFVQQTLKISTGTKIVSVIKVDPKHPKIRFEVGLPNSRLNVTEDFEKMARAKGAKAAINANFFSSYAPVKDPIGHVMIDGKLVYGQSGITSLGITRNKDLVFGTPGIFTRMFADGKRTNDMRIGGSAFYNVWAAYEVNTRNPAKGNTIMYTPDRGDSIEINAPGYVATVRNKELQSFARLNPPQVVNIPKDGYVTFFGSDVVSKWNGDNGLTKGRNIETEYYLFKGKDASFKLDEMQWMISGAPDLVINGKISTAKLPPGFTDSRFTTAKACRTAIGVRKDGLLLLVNAKNLKISELKEIMFKLGCVNAINLDGGASSGMYYDGKVIAKPGRKLATMFYVYQDQ